MNLLIKHIKMYLDDRKNQKNEQKWIEKERVYLDLKEKVNEIPENHKRYQDLKETIDYFWKINIQTLNFEKERIDLKEKIKQSKKQEERLYKLIIKKLYEN